MKAERQRLAVQEAKVWLSAALSPNGAPSQVMRVVLLGLAVFSEPTIAELETRIWKPKFDLYISLEAPESMLRDARAEALWVETPRELAGQH